MTGIPDLDRFIRSIQERGDQFLGSDIKLDRMTPPEWNERKLERCAPPELHTTFASLEEARTELPRLMLEYLHLDAPKHMLLIKALPGVGKTTAAVGVAEAMVAEGWRIGYAGPRHDFFEQIMDKAKYPQFYYEWLARQAGSETKPETCRFAEDIAKFIARGYRATEYCFNKCQFHMSQCPYMLQKGRQEPIIYLQHLHIVNGNPIGFSGIIGDETPYQAFMRHWTIPGRFIMPPGMPYDQPMTEIMLRLSTLAANAQHIEGEELMLFLGGAGAVMEACEVMGMTEDEDLQAMKPTFTDDIEELPYYHIFETVNLLKREALSELEGVKHVNRIFLDNGKLHLLLRKRVYGKMPGHIIWLDATGNERIYKTLFGRPVQVVDVAPPIKGKIRQVVDRQNGKSSVISGDNITSKGDQLKKQIENIARRYRNPAVISYQKLVEGLDVPHAHFYAARGTNAFEDCDCIIIAGTPQPGLPELVTAAKMIFFDRNVIFDVNKFYPRKAVYGKVFLDEDGTAYGKSYPVSGYWDDEDMQAILSASREDEILQAAHRGRPVNRAVDIWLLLNQPIDGLPPDELIEIRDIFGAPEGFDVFSWDTNIQKINEIADQKGGVIGMEDLYEIMAQKTARKYFNELAKTWKVIKIPSAGKFKPKKFLDRGE